MDADALAARIAALELKVAEQQRELTRLADIEAIKKLQKAYGYYVEHMMYQEIVDCFADDLETKLDWLAGKYLRKDGVQRYFEFMKTTPPEVRPHVMQIAGPGAIDAARRHAGHRARGAAGRSVGRPLDGRRVKTREPEEPSRPVTVDWTVEVPPGEHTVAVEAVGPASRAASTSRVNTGPASAALTISS